MFSYCAQVIIKQRAASWREAKAWWLGRKTKGWEFSCPESWKAFARLLPKEEKQEDQNCIPIPRATGKITGKAIIIIGRKSTKEVSKFLEEWKTQGFLKTGSFKLPNYWNRISKPHKERSQEESHADVFPLRPVLCFGRQPSLFKLSDRKKFELLMILQKRLLKGLWWNRNLALSVHR